MIICFAQNAADASVGVLDEGTCVTIEIDALLGVEQHVLSGIHLQDEILEGSHTNDAGNLATLLLSHIVELAQFHRSLIGIADHQFHQVVSINHSAFATLHLAIGKLHHAV